MKTLPMQHTWATTDQNRSVEYKWKVDHKWQSICVNAHLEQEEIPTGSETEFITEHYWGYSKINSTKTTEYEVTHPRWMHYPVKILPNRCRFCFNLWARICFFKWTYTPLCNPC